MNTLIRTLGTLAAMLLLISGCNFHGVPAPSEAGTVPKAPAYQTVLGKSLNDEVPINFVASNGCSAAGSFQLCKEAGMALWIDSDQIVTLVYLYSGNADGFRRYRGELPFGLTFYDPMWLVEEKLRDLEAEDRIQPAATAGLPDEGSSPDHFHYWAVYKRFGVTVIYDTPFADQDAYIYAVLVNNLSSEE